MHKFFQSLRDPGYLNFAVCQSLRRVCEMTSFGFEDLNGACMMLGTFNQCLREWTKP